MPPKHKSNANSGDATKKRKTITMEDKLEIIQRAERGETQSSIGRAFCYSRSTISTILKDKSRILEHMKDDIPLNATIISKKRSGLIIEMERLLTIWIEDQNQRNMPISLALVQEKARSLFSDLKAADKSSEDDCNKEFVASRGWFNRFKKRANLHSIKVQDEVGSADISAACDFPKLLKNIIDDGGYLPQQIFNVDETGLYWKKMPERTYIAKEERNAPGHRTSKDKLTLLLGGNAAGDFKLRPLLVHHSLNSRVLCNVSKAFLPVIWRANSKSRVTVAVFQDWFLNHFIPAVKHYCLGKSIPFKILLLLDSAPVHPVTLDGMHPNVKVVFLPPNITLLFQPMDQGIMAVLKAYYLQKTFSQAVRVTQKDKMTLRDFWKNYNIHDAIENIANAWDEVKETNMREVWHKLCPQFTQEFSGFTDDEIAKTRQAVLALGNQLQLDLTEDDIIELLDSHDKELFNEDLLELQQQMIAFREENQDPESARFNTFSIEALSDAFCLIEAGMAKLEEQDTDTERFAKVYNTVTKSLKCYRAIFEEKKMEEKRKKGKGKTSPDAYFMELTPGAESDSDSLIKFPSSSTSPSSSMKNVHDCT